MKITRKETYSLIVGISGLACQIEILSKQRKVV